MTLKKKVSRVAENRKSRNNHKNLFIKFTNMKNLKLNIAVILLIFAISSCEKIEQTSQPDEYQLQDGMIQLGKKLENPYSVETMAKAINIVSPNTLKSSEELQTTHLYVRFLPSSPEELESLNSDTMLNLYDYPLDYEIIQEGDYYHDPSISSDDITWQYTVVEPNYVFPSVKYEILAELYLPDEDEDEIEDVALEITGNSISEDETTGLKSTQGRRRKYKPSGNILIQDDVLGTDVGLRNAKVRIRNWFKIRNVQTRADGSFGTSTEYKGNVDIKVIFENNHCKVRSTLVNILGTADKKLANEVKSLNIVICRENRNFSTTPVQSGYRNIRDDKLWAWATVFNGVEEYRDYCVSENIAVPQDGLRIWVNRNSRANRNGEGTSGAAPMFHRGWGFYKINGDKWWAYAADVLYIPVSNVLVNLFDSFLPDIVITYGTENVNSADLCEVVYHELGHASHYTKVGGNYWYKYINYTVTNNGYGDGSGHNNGICALGEAWGYHVGWTFARMKYVGNAPVSLNVQENFEPIERGQADGMTRFVDNAGNTTGYESWIPAGLMHDLTETNRDLVRTSFRDEADGYTNQQIFAAMDWGIETPQAFRDRLLRENSDRDLADVEDLFEAYYFD